MIVPTNNKMINQIYMNQSPNQQQQPIIQKPGSSYKQVKASEEHKLVL